ncbi:hypothetical protein [Halobacteriovorax sp. RT-1-4]|uniref:hypothetical protein n=1 Tax=unclassified Halobacteriovorax TaxID=2639665 RepID=UPI00399B61F0
MRLIILSLLSQILLSCATIYTGDEYKSVDLTDIEQVKSSVTFRFVKLHDVSDQSSWHNKNWFIKSTVKNSYECDVVKKINLFNIVKCDIEENFDKVAASYTSIEEFDREHPIEFDTDYYVDVRVLSPFYYHGSGTGMYGLVFSALTLGIIPSYWTYEGDYDIRIYSKKDQINFKKIQYTENYGAISSSLFWLFPSSRYEGVNLRENYMIRNKWEYILKEVILKIKDK